MYGPLGKLKRLAFISVVSAKQRTVPGTWQPWQWASFLLPDVTAMDPSPDGVLQVTLLISVAAAVIALDPSLTLTWYPPLSFPCAFCLSVSVILHLLTAFFPLS